MGIPRLGVKNFPLVHMHIAELVGWLLPLLPLTLGEKHIVDMDPAGVEPHLVSRCLKVVEDIVVLPWTVDLDHKLRPVVGRGLPQKEENLPLRPLHAARDAERDGETFGAGPVAHNPASDGCVQVQVAVN